MHSSRIPIEGGLALGRISSSPVIAAAMIILVALTSRRDRFSPLDGRKKAEG